MLKSIKNKGNILFSCMMILVCFFAYQYWAGAETSNSQLISVKDSGVGSVGSETLKLLAELRTLVLDEDIFVDEVFQNLEDFSMELQPQPIGRNNPFAPVGTDGEYVGVKIDFLTVTKCDDGDCFEEKFAECGLATLEVKDLGLDELFGMNPIYQYEILGLKGQLCEVKSKFIANPNPEWVGKEMICRYDNSQNFDIAVKDMSRCSGELYDMMTE